MNDMLRIGMLLHPLNTTDWGRYHAKQFDRAPDIADSQIWDEMVTLALRAEVQGFDSLWITEHHVTPYGLGPDPLQTMTYFAGKTERIGLGTSVVVLPWHNPVRVAEQIALLHMLAPERRLQIGFGRGVAPVEFAHLGIDQNESRERFDEGVEIIKAALSSHTFSYNGDKFQIPETHLRPQPRSQAAIDAVVADFLCAFGSPASLEAAASRGLRPAFIQGKPPEEVRADVITFNRIRTASGFAAVQPTVAEWIFCAPTEAEAWQGAVKYMGAQAAELSFHYQHEEMAEEFAKLKGYEHYATTGRLLNSVDYDTRAEMFASAQVWGTPEMCFEKLRDRQTGTAASEFICFFKYGGMPFEVAEASQALFAEAVLPELKKLPATFHDWADPTRAGVGASAS